MDDEELSRLCEIEERGMLKLMREGSRKMDSILVDREMSDTGDE